MPTQVRTDDLLRELTEASSFLQRIVERLPERDPVEMEVWSVYAVTEKVVAILKFRIGVERPGLVTELPRARISRELLPPALVMMKESRTNIESNQLLEGLETLRRARNNLRAYLSQERKARIRQKRRTATPRPSS